MESDKKNYCSQRQCPIHACMSNDCQIEHVKESGPHIILEFAPQIIKYCPHLDVFYSVQCELRTFANVFNPDEFNAEESELDDCKESYGLSVEEVIEKIRTAFEKGEYTTHEVEPQGCRCRNDGSHHFTVYVFFKDYEIDDIRELQVFVCNECGDWFITDNF